MGVDDLVLRISGVDDIEGITFSGGEPFEQAHSLARIARRAREVRDLGVVCFTGYTREELLSGGPPSAADLLDEVDLLIDGPFLAARPRGPFWRGSDNQRLHHLSSRYVGLTDSECSASGMENELEVEICGGRSIITGDLAHSPIDEVAALLDRLHGVRL